MDIKEIIEENFRTGHFKDNKAGAQFFKEKAKDISIKKRTKGFIKKLTKEDVEFLFS